MIATYNQVKTEMRTKEAEFTRELQRAQYREAKALNRIAKLIGRIQGRTNQTTGRS